MNRSGTMVYEDNEGGSDSSGGLLFLVLIIFLTFIFYKWFKVIFPKYSDAANFNFAWIAAGLISFVGLIVLNK